MNPPAEDRFSPTWEICELQFRIAMKDLDARLNEQMADAKYPQSIEIMKDYILEKCDLYAKLLLHQAEQHLEEPWLEHLETIMEIVREKWIQDFAEMLSAVPVKLKRDTLSSVDLQPGAKIARLIEHIRRLQYEALTASAIEVPPEQAVSTAHEIAVSARSEQPGSSEPSTTEENNVRTGFLEHAEYLALRDELPEELKMLLVIGYYTGVRRGELINIKWNEVDMKARRIRLDVGTTKNKEGRYLPIYAEMAEWIEMARSIRNEKFPNCPWLFHRSGERILNFRKAWETARTAAGLPEILVHDLRRTAARNMVRAGIPEKIVMMITGHKTRAMLDRYNIVNDRDLDLAAARMDAHLGTLSGTPEDVGTKSKGKEKIVSPLN